MTLFTIAAAIFWGFIIVLALLLLITESITDNEDV